MHVRAALRRVFLKDPAHATGSAKLTSRTITPYSRSIARPSCLHTATRCAFRSRVTSPQRNTAFMLFAGPIGITLGWGTVASAQGAALSSDPANLPSASLTKVQPSESAPPPDSEPERMKEDVLVSPNSPHEETTAASVHDQEEAQSSDDYVGSVGLQWFAVRDKVMAGVSARLSGERWALRLELSGMWTTSQVPEVDATFLGTPLALYLEVIPFHLDRLDVSAGVGADQYPLWGIHGDFFELALATRVDATFWFARSFGVSGAARYHVIASDGLDLGTNRDGSAGLPVLFSVGLLWRSK